ncbi:AI-2E family transporter [Clostridium sp. AM29-11AC]|uniref:AI-2E family transporter n=1 Tax=Clostridium sp. AM29-11AC TaxID=2293028 RepID=UPI000E5232B4|nr:AI-2E family transporter [Clostridium sp. AM29-11AC]RHT57623.1 AI-2E family transporter [Clostridium sp. AM29-11AC]
MELNKDNMKKIMLLILYTIVILALAFRMEYVFGFLRGGLRLMFPFLLGAAIAFILNVPMRFIEKNILGGLLRMKETSRAKRPLSLLLAILFVLVIVAVVSLVVIPELTGTLLGLKRLVPAFFENMQIQAEAMFARYPEIVEFINSIEIDWKTLMEETASFITSGAGNLLSSTVTAAVSIASGLTTFSISFIFSLYILLQKETLSRQFKQLCYAYFPESAVDKGLGVLRMTERIFSKFLTGQCTEAVILGTMFFVTLTILRLPFALLIGVLIAFTALIPIFGAFIGCAVGIFLMLMVSPVQAIWFTIIFLVLQQIEGNLIYPYVVGSSVGLPSIWVLVAVSLGGSMMGIVGMLIFIPLCSVGYTLLKEDVGIQLAGRNVKADKYLKRFSEREAGAKMSGSGKKAEKTENKKEKETEKD